MSVLVENNPISFNRVSGLLARKGYWLESLTMGGTEDPEVSRIIFTVNCEDWTLGQLKSQLEKLADVIKTEPEYRASLYSRAAFVKAK
jgi:acetolactate synthase-1/3 small subunit